MTWSDSLAFVMGIKPYHKEPEGVIFHADCMDILKAMPSQSADLIVTDPPYGYGFMKKRWDKAVPPVTVWKECLRVLKPGAFAFIMCAPRQDCLSHMIVNLDEAGFRTDFTSLYWLYGSGFPKSANISKLIDKRACMKELTEVLGRNPTKEEFDEAWENFRTIIAREEMTFGVGGASERHGSEKITTLPETPKAKELDGSYAGFSPKPAVEIVITVMKPLQGANKNKMKLDFEQLREMKGILLKDSL